MKKKNTQDKRKGSLKKLSKVGIQNLIRPHVPDLIAKALHMSEHGDNSSCRLGAIKLLLSKVVPDLKSEDLKIDPGSTIQVNIIKDNTLKDANN